MLTFIQLEFAYRDARDQGNRKANIVCTDKQNAIDFLRLSGNVHVMNIGSESLIHAYTDEALQHLLDKLNINTTENISTTPEDIQTSEVTNPYICPWCDKPFPKPQGLKVHIQRMHTKKEE